VKMGAFLNEFDANLQTGVIVFIVIAAPTFGYFYNRLMDNLKGESEHTSLYVAIGVTITLAFGSLLSWKASLLLLSIFCLTGLPMIVGEYLRTERKRKTAPRRKRLPYAANGMIDDAKIAATETHRLIGKALQSDTKEEIYKSLAGASHELTTIANKLNEVKSIQLEK
jgi:hypothetical protein